MLFINRRKHVADNNYRCGLAPLVARKPIPVFKVLQVVGSDLYGPYHPIRYSRNTVITSPIETLAGKWPAVKVGLHSYRNFAPAQRETETFLGVERVVYRAVIPKGALYYFGTDYDIVSNGLYVLDEKLCGMSAPKSFLIEDEFPIEEGEEPELMFPFGVVPSDDD